jgi:hypothetical protein
LRRILDRRLLKMLSMWQLKMPGRSQLRIQGQMIPRAVHAGLTTATKKGLADASTIVLAGSTIVTMTDRVAALTIVLAGSTAVLMIGRTGVLMTGLVTLMIVLAAASMKGMTADASGIVTSVGMLMSVPMTGLSGHAADLEIVQKAVLTDPDEVLMTARAGLTAAPMTVQAGHIVIMIQMMN